MCSLNFSTVIKDSIFLGIAQKNNVFVTIVFWTFWIIPYKTATSQNVSHSFKPYEKLEHKNDRMVRLMEKLHAKELEVMNIKMKILMDRQHQLLDMNRLLTQGGTMYITQTKTLSLSQNADWLFYWSQILVIFLINHTCST